MIRYTLVRTGKSCDRACAFCPERGQAPLPLEELRPQLFAAPRPANLYLGEGDPAAHPDLVTLLAEARLDPPRRVKLKVTRPLPGELFQQLLGLGVLVYELECLGPTAAVHDAVTGRKGSFGEMVAAARQLGGGRRGRPRRGQRARAGHLFAPFWVLRVPVCSANRASLPALVDRVLGWAPDRVVFVNGGDAAVSRLALDLQAACARLVSAEIWPVLSGFPLCAVPGLEYFCQEPYDRPVAHPPAAICDGCVLAPACAGVAPAYLEAFGGGELCALRWHRHQEDLLALAAKRDAASDGAA